MTYIFKVYFNILEEAGITTSGIEIEPIEFSKIALKRENELTEIQIGKIKQKLNNFYNTKFNLTTMDSKLDTIIK